MTEKKISTVRDVAEKIKKDYYPFYANIELPHILTEELLNANLAEQSLAELSRRIGNQRFFILGYLAGEFDMAEGYTKSVEVREQMSKFISGDIFALSPQQQQNVMDVRFLAELENELSHS